MNIAIVVAVCLGLISGGVSAQNYPQRAVRLIVAYPAGGSIDTVARLTAQRLSTALGQQFLVDNRSGAAGIIGTDNVAKAQADGRRMGFNISDAEVIKWLTYNPAKALGIDAKTGSLKAGKMADLVLWNGNPLSVYARPDKVWIDGALMFDSSNPKLRPVSDFELGQPGEGDVK